MSEDSVKEKSLVDGGATEEGAPLLMAAAERVDGGDLMPVLRIPLLVVRHGADWLTAPALTAAAMGGLAMLDGGVRGLINGCPTQVAGFLVLVPALIWGALFVGTEGCREDLGGELDGSLADRWRRRVPRYLETMPLLGLQVLWLGLILMSAALFDQRYFPELAYPAIFWAGFSSYFLLAEHRLAGRATLGSFLVGHMRAARALALWPLDLLAHGAMALYTRGRGLLRPSGATLGARALATVAAMVFFGIMGLSFGSRLIGLPISLAVRDALTLAIGSFWFTLAAQIGSSWTAYENAALYAAESGLLPGGGVVGMLHTPLPDSAPALPDGASAADIGWA